MWRAATPSGTYVFYTEGEQLFRFDVATKTRTAVTEGSAGVLGTLGVSDDGADAYFTATEALSGAENENGEHAVAGKANLYLWSDGALTFVAALDSAADEADWAPRVIETTEGPAEGGKGARVTPSGKDALFVSRARLTSYDNDGHQEMYLYDADLRRLTCASCNPSAAPATTDTFLDRNVLVKEAMLEMTFVTRNLAADGSRVFFQTSEALVPQDVNAEADVYEWERDGTGSCSQMSDGFSLSSGGCVFLVSTGQSQHPSYFGDSDSDGDNVFFFTRQSLVKQDEDQNNDLYDARVGGGLAAQNSTPQPACAADACSGPSGPQPAFGTPASATFVGLGNIPPAVPGAGPGHTAVRLTRARALARALRACAKRKPRRARNRCRAEARKHYAGKRRRKPLTAGKTRHGQPTTSRSRRR